MKTFIPIFVCSIIGGIIGGTLSSPISHNLYESIPGQGYSRSCSPGDMFCNSTRNQEMYSGRSYRTRSVDSKETLQQQFIYGGIGVAAGFIPSALLMGIINRKKTKLPSKEEQ